MDENSRLRARLHRGRWPVGVRRDDWAALLSYWRSGDGRCGCHLQPGHILCGRLALLDAQGAQGSRCQGLARSESLLGDSKFLHIPPFSSPLSPNILLFAPSFESSPPPPSRRKNGKTDSAFLGSQTVFMVSCSMFCLILFEVLDVLSHEARWLNWKFDLSLLSVLLIFVLPFYFFYLLLSNIDLGYKQAAVFAFAPTALYLWAFYTVTNSLPITGHL